MPHLKEHRADWIGRMLTDASGHKIGRIDDIYTDDDTGQPEWLAVTTGLMGPNTHFVPLRGATVSGGGVQVPFPKEQVKVAPSAAADGRLSRMEKGRLYAHYGYSHAEERNRLQCSLGFDLPVQTRPAAGRVPSQALALRDTSGPSELRIPSQALALGDAGPPADWRTVMGSVDRPSEVEEPPSPRPREGRGRWPDDEAIFGLSQPTLAAGGAPRRR